MRQTAFTNLKNHACYKIYIHINLVAVDECIFRKFYLQGSKSNTFTKNIMIKIIKLSGLSKYNTTLSHQ